LRIPEEFATDALKHLRRRVAMPTVIDRHAVQQLVHRALNWLMSSERGNTTRNTFPVQSTSR
jgi:hypothetical protein